MTPRVTLVEVPGEIFTLSVVGERGWVPIRLEDSDKMEFIAVFTTPEQAAAYITCDKFPMDKVQEELEPDEHIGLVQWPTRKLIRDLRAHPEFSDSIYLALDIDPDNDKRKMILMKDVTDAQMYANPN